MLNAAYLRPPFETESNGSGKPSPPRDSGHEAFLDICGLEPGVRGRDGCAKGIRTGDARNGEAAGGWSGLLTNFAICEKVIRREPPAEAAHRPNAFAASLASRGLVGHGVSNRWRGTLDDRANAPSRV